MRRKFSIVEAYTVSLTNATIVISTTKPEIVPYILGRRQGAACVKEVDTPLLGRRSSSAARDVVVAVDGLIVLSLRASTS